MLDQLRKSIVFLFHNSYFSFWRCAKVFLTPLWQIKELIVASVSRCNYIEIMTESLPWFSVPQNCQKPLLFFLQSGMWRRMNASIMRSCWSTAESIWCSTPTTCLTSWSRVCGSPPSPTTSASWRFALKLLKSWEAFI